MDVCDSRNFLSDLLTFGISKIYFTLDFTMITMIHSNNCTHSCLILIWIFNHFCFNLYVSKWKFSYSLNRIMFGIYMSGNI